MRHLLLLFVAATLAACSGENTVPGFELNDSPRAASAEPFFDAEGAEVWLADYEGTVILVNIWATWCAPCVHEMPQLDRLHQRYADQGFAVLAISTDRESFADVELYLREEIGAEHIPLYMDPQLGFTLDSRVGVWPTTILYNARGEELGRIAGPAEWDSAEAHRLIEWALAQGTE